MNKTIRKIKEKLGKKVPLEDTSGFGAGSNMMRADTYVKRFSRMKKGGRVKGKCKVDGIAQRGKTRAKHK